MASDDVLFADFLEHVQNHTLAELVVDEAFVHGFHASSADNRSEQYFEVHDVLVDMLHDSFGLNSEQRRAVKQSLMNKEFTLREIYEQYEVRNAAATPPPSVQLVGPTDTPGGAVGLSGPFPFEQAPRMPTASAPPAPSLTAGLAEGAAMFTEEDHNPFALPALPPLTPAETSIGRLNVLEKEVQGEVKEVPTLLKQWAPVPHGSRERNSKGDENTLPDSVPIPDAGSFHRPARGRRADRLREASPELWEGSLTFSQKLDLHERNLQDLHSRTIVLEEHAKDTAGQYVEVLKEVTNHKTYSNNKVDQVEVQLKNLAAQVEAISNRLASQGSYQAGVLPAYPREDHAQGFGNPQTQPHWAPSAPWEQAAQRVPHAKSVGWHEPENFAISTPQESPDLPPQSLDSRFAMHQRPGPPYFGQRTGPYFGAASSPMGGGSYPSPMGAAIRHSSNQMCPPLTHST